MKKMGSVWAIALAASAAIACSSSSGDSGAASGPVQQCNDFASAYCNRAVDCLDQAGISNASTKSNDVQACLTQAESSAQCSKAVGVSATYSACMNDLPNAPCAPIVAIAQGTGSASAALPTDCDGAIKISP
jgi:hypothetical protein